MVDKKEVKETVWPMTAFGSAVHNALEHFFVKLAKDHDAFLDIKKNGAWSRKAIAQYMPKTFKQEWEHYFAHEVEAKKDRRSFKETRGWDVDADMKLGQDWSEKCIYFLLRYMIPPIDAMESEKKISFLGRLTRVSGRIDVTTASVDTLGVPRTDAIDFKNTKHTSKYYFVDWQRDPQSLIYAKALSSSEDFIRSFAYFAFNPVETVILVQKFEYPSFEFIDENFAKLENRFVRAHSMSADVSRYASHPDVCKWCEYKKVCPVSRSK